MDKLKSRIDGMYPTRAAFAEKIGIDPSSLSRMLARGNWRADKIEKAIDALNISAKDIPEYFFAHTVANKATR